MTSNKVIYTYRMTENTRTLCASLNLQQSAIEKAPVTGAMSAASQTQAPHWYKVCRTWARWKRCSPAGSRTATALSHQQSPGRRRRSARDGEGVPLGMRAATMRPSAGPVAYDGPRFCAAHVTFAGNCRAIVRSAADGPDASTALCCHRG